MAARGSDNERNVKGLNFYGSPPKKCSVGVLIKKTKNIPNGKEQNKKKPTKHRSLNDMHSNSTPLATPPTFADGH